jgi:hypothetical protein
MSNKLYYGVDAQPIGSLDWVKSLGANAVNRFDPGPQKTDNLVDWLVKARTLGLSYIIQGTVADAQGYPICSRVDSNLISIAQDDEPDLNRWNAMLTAAQQPNVNPKDGSVHPSIVGWTRPEILQQRYDTWRSKMAKGGIPNIPISLNFNGTTLTNQWSLAKDNFHLPYIKASDYQSMDSHSINNKKDLNQIMFAFRRIGYFGGTGRGGYFEVSDEKLGTGGRGPTVAEQSTEMWGLLMYGATEVWAFPQRMGANFAYNGMAPENEARLKRDFGLLAKYSDLIANGQRSIVESPGFVQDASKGTYTLPLSGSVTWSANNVVLKVIIDFTGKTDVQILEPTPEDPLAKLQAQYNALIGQYDNLNAIYKTLKSNYDALNVSHTELNGKVEQIKGILQ